MEKKVFRIVRNLNGNVLKQSEMRCNKSRMDAAQELRHCDELKI